MTVVNPITGNQVTRYLYGTDRTSISPIIYRNDLLTAEIYPDSVENPADGIADRVEYQYNRLGERVWKRDQNGTVHQYDYDNLGRMIHDRVTDVGTGVDTAVRRISTVYNINGQVERLTSWDNPMVGTGSIVNEVRYEYNQYGLLGKEYSNPVGGADMSLYTEYFYDTSRMGEYFTKKLRLTGYQTPSRYVQSYHFYNMENDYLNRPDRIGMDISYGYTGVSTISKVTYHPVDAELDYTQPGALDQFNRVIRHTWKRSTGQVLVDIQHTYDRSGNRLTRTDLLASSQGLSEEYSYDQMNQLAGLQRENNSFERFHYDAAGNHVQTTTDSAVETQTFNKANEIIAINNNSNAVSNDRNGNMTRIPGKVLTYDAWNRLVRVSNEIGTIAEYGYDALNRRVLKHTYDPTSSMPLIETREYYYNRNWQCLEELVYGNCAVRYLWGLRYIDDLVGFTSSYDFALTDANFNVVAVVNQTNVPERYTYSAFGSRAVRDEDFNIKSTTSYPALTRAFTGQVLDPDTGLMLYRNRYYSPSLGRFITRDPIGYASDNVNLFSYVSNMTISNLDIYGLQSTVCCEFKKDNEYFVQQISCSYSKGTDKCCNETLKGFWSYGWILNRSTRQPCKEIDNPLKIQRTCTTMVLAPVAVPSDPTDVVFIPLFLITAATCFCTASKIYIFDNGTTFDGIDLPDNPGMCEFYYLWCLWGNNRSPSDKGKYWTKNAPCHKCYLSCKKNSKWPVGTCGMGGKRGPRFLEDFENSVKPDTK